MSKNSSSHQFNQASQQAKLGLLCGIAAFLLWGTLPIYWKKLDTISPAVITAHRILWSTVSLFLIISVRRRLPILIEKVKQPRFLASSFISGALLITNWLIYVWATNNDRVIEVSLGYYILPLMLILLGYFILSEPLNKLQLTAFFFATLGVIFQGIGIGSLPVLALGVSVSFAIYSLVKKMMKSDGFTALIVETGVLCPIAIGYLLFHSEPVWGDASATTITLLLFTGIATISPLLFFTAAAKRIPFTTIGMIQFIAPTGQFLLGYFYFKEPLNQTQLLSFILIWFAVFLYAYSKKPNKT